MAAGKGALRIAFEDLLETFEFGKIAAKWVKEIGEDNELAIAGGLKDLLSEAAAAEDSPEVIRTLASNLSGRQAQGGIATAVGFATSVGSSAAGAMLAPVWRKLNYKIDRKARSARLDPEAIIRAAWRWPGGAGDWREDYADLGWSEDRIQALAGLLAARPGIVDLITLWRRGVISDSEYLDSMRKLGAIEHDRELIERLSEVVPGVGDLVRMAVREAWRDDVAAKWGYDQDYPVEFEQAAKTQGVLPEWSKRYWRAHWELPGPNIGYEMLHRLRPGTTDYPFTRDDMLSLLRIADFPAGFRDRMIEISYAPFTRVDLRRLYQSGVITYERTVAGYQDIGYTPEMAKQLADFAAAEGGSTGKDLTRAAITKAYKQSILKRDDAAALLVSIGYDQETTEFWLAQAEFEAAQEKLDEVVKNVEFMYVNSEYDTTDVSAELGKYNMPADQVQQLLIVWDIKRQGKAKIPSTSELEDFYTRNIINRDQIIGDLAKAGWDLERVIWILARIDQETAENARAEQERAQKEQERLAVSKQATAYQKDKADVDVAIAGRRLAIADLKLAIGSTTDKKLIENYTAQVDAHVIAIAEYNLLKANIKADFYGKLQGQKI